MPITNELERLRRTNVCAICGRQLYIYFNPDTKEKYIACPTPGHTGIAKPCQLPDEYETKLRSLSEMENEKSQALTKYAGTGYLTVPQAQEIIVTIWPGAPQVEVTKAAMVCQQYGLNPLMKHLYLIPFNTNVGTKQNPNWVKTYAMVLGIKASRIIARRKGQYAYIDDTPRIMTSEEQIKIFGEVDTENICAITRLKTPRGDTAIGTGKWLRSAPVKGDDKGNTKLNMAMIRSERQALERLFPDSLPSEVPDVVDERYQELDEGRKVDTDTGEIIDAPLEGEIVETAEPVSEAVTVQPEATGGKPNTEAKSIGDLTFANQGEFLTACKDNYGLTKAAVLKEAPEYDLDKPEQRKQAWQAICAVYNQ